MLRERIWKFHEHYIKRTYPEAHVSNAKMRLTKITRRTRNAINCRNKKIYMRTRALKHLYDKKPAEEFDFMIDHIEHIIRNPDRLYVNKGDKTGNFCLVKRIDAYDYLVVIEIVGQNTKNEEAQIVTAFRVRNEKYLLNYELLRSWRDGAHSS